MSSKSELMRQNNEKILELKKRYYDKGNEFAKECAKEEAARLDRIQLHIETSEHGVERYMDEAKRVRFTIGKNKLANIARGIEELEETNKAIAADWRIKAMEFDGPMRTELFEMCKRSEERDKLFMDILTKNHELIAQEVEALRTIATALTNKS